MGDDVSHDVISESKEAKNQSVAAFSGKLNFPTYNNIYDEFMRMFMLLYIVS